MESLSIAPNVPYLTRLLSANVDRANGTKQKNRHPPSSLAVFVVPRGKRAESNLPHKQAQVRTRPLIHVSGKFKFLKSKPLDVRNFYRRNLNNKFRNHYLIFSSTVEQITCSYHFVSTVSYKKCHPLTSHLFFFLLVLLDLSS